MKKLIALFLIIGAASSHVAARSTFQGCYTATLKTLAYCQAAYVAPLAMFAVEYDAYPDLYVCYGCPEGEDDINCPEADGGGSWDNASQACTGGGVGCSPGEVSGSCPGEQCSQPSGTVGTGQSCPSDLAQNETDFGCITSGAAHTCDSNYPLNAGQGTSDTDGDGLSDNGVIIGEDGTTNRIPSGTGAEYGGSSGSSGSGGGGASSTPVEIPSGGANTPLSDYCSLYPDAVACFGWEQVEIMDVCNHGGAPDPQIGCDYTYAPPTGGIGCGFKQVTDLNGNCVTPPTIIGSKPEVGGGWNVPTDDPPNTYDPTFGDGTNDGGTTIVTQDGSTTTVENNITVEAPNVTVTVNVPESEPIDIGTYTGWDKAPRSYFNQAGMQLKIDTKLQAIDQTITSMKDLINADISLSSLEGLPCLGTINYETVSQPLCLSDYESELSGIGTAIIFIAFFIAAAILFRRG